MVAGGLLWLLVVWNGCWWFVMVAGGLLWLLVVWNGCWWFVMVAGGLKWLLVYCSGRWWFVMVAGGLKWSPVVWNGRLWFEMVAGVFYGRWWFEMVAGGLKWLLVVFYSFWCFFYGFWWFLDCWKLIRSRWNQFQATNHVEIRTVHLHHLLKMKMMSMKLPKSCGSKLSTIGEITESEIVISWRSVKA